MARGLVFLAGIALSAAIAFAQGGHADIPELYMPPPAAAATLKDPVSKLVRTLEGRKAGLAYDAALGFLPSLLRELRIPVSSQTLVFSKTSLQHEYITPRTPRAIYFNDDTYVAFVPDSRVIEISAVEPTRGAVFYTLTQARTAEPHLVTGVECIQCHAVAATLGVPGHIMRSVFARGDGRLAPMVPSFLTDHRSPIEERWGGWFVTGTLSGQLHMGNAVLRSGEDHESFDRTRGAAITSLAGRIDGTRYPAAESDVVALMVLGHQVRLHNLLARLHLKSARSLPVTSDVEELVRYMLFAEEAPLKGTVTGSTTFAAEFERLGPADAKGRSLRQFDLRTRLFRYPCSYLIYSDAFRALPPAVKQQVYARLVDVLSGRDTGGAFESLRPADRTAIAEILTATDPEFAAAIK